MTTGFDPGQWRCSKIICGNKTGPLRCTNIWIIRRADRRHVCLEHATEDERKTWNERKARLLARISIKK